MVLDYNIVIKRNYEEKNTEVNIAHINSLFTTFDRTFMSQEVRKISNEMCKSLLFSIIKLSKFCFKKPKQAHTISDESVTLH